MRDLLVRRRRVAVDLGAGSLPPPKPSGMRVATLAASTPGSSRTRASSSLQNSAAARRVVAGRQQIDRRQRAPFRVEKPGSTDCAFVQRAHEQPGRHQQHQRQRDLRDDQRLSQRARAAATRSPRPADSFSAVITERDVACSAGTSPNTQRGRPA